MGILDANEVLNGMVYNVGSAGYDSSDDLTYGYVSIETVLGIGILPFALSGNRMGGQITEADVFESVKKALLVYYNMLDYDLTAREISDYVHIDNMLYRLFGAKLGDYAEVLNIDGTSNFRPI